MLRLVNTAQLTDLKIKFATNKYIIILRKIPSEKTAALMVTRLSFLNHSEIIRTATRISGKLHR